MAQTAPAQTFADAASIFGAAPAVDHVRISPDGERVLAISANHGKRGLAVIDLAKGSVTVALQLGAAKYLDACEWASTERIVCSMFVFQGPAGKTSAAPFPRRRRVRLVAVDHDGGNTLALLNRRPRVPPKIGGVLSVPHAPHQDLEHALVHPLPDDPAYALVAAAREATPYRTVYRVHLYTGAATPLVGWQAGIMFWHADRLGRVRAGTGAYEFGDKMTQEPWRGPTAVVADAGDRLQRVDVSALSARIGQRELAGPRVLGFSSDATRLYYEARVEGADRTAVWEADAITLNPLREVVSHSTRDVRAQAIAGRDCGVVGFMHPLPGRPFTWLDDHFGRSVEAAAQGSDRGALVAVTSMSMDCRHVVLASTDGRSRRGFHMLDRSTGRLQRLGEQFPAAADVDASRRREVRYRTRDGLDLPMALTMPTTGRTPLPVVVLLDGGPGPDSSAALDTWPRFFADRGYVVAQPAFRGRRGYGTAFHLAGLRNFGAKVQEDVADAVAWLDDAGLGEPDRVCFIGRGRGGHFALVAAYSGILEEAEGGRRCAAAYAAMNLAHTKRTEDTPFDGRLCAYFPCGDWLRWASPRTMRALSRGRASPPFSPTATGVAMSERNNAESAAAANEVGKAAHSLGAGIGKDEEAALARARREVNAPDSSMLRSPLVDAKHPGFPVLIHADGRSVVHERGTRRFRADLAKLGFFEQVAPVGSDDEGRFLNAAATLFNQVLDGSEGER